MLSRRRFLSLTSITAGASLAPRAAMAQRGSPTQVPDLPSIAALPSLRGLARPISNEERLARIEKARKMMAAQGVGAILLMGGTSLRYFANISWGLSERFFGMIIPAKGEPFFACPAFELDRAQEQVKFGPYAGKADIRIWQEDESPYALVARGLRTLGLATGALGIEETARFVFSDGVSKAAPALRIVSATAITAGCRMIKDAHEIELIRLASRVTLNAFGAAYRGLRAGMTQGEYGALVSAAHAKQGFPGGGGVQVGEFTALPHGSVTPQTIRDGSILLQDGGCSAEGYSSDISRTFVCGKPTDRMRKVFDLVHRMQAAGLSSRSMRPLARSPSTPASAPASSTSRTASVTASAWTATSGPTS
jgi:Xaa-Pro dipeptidase